MEQPHYHHHHLVFHPASVASPHTHHHHCHHHCHPHHHPHPHHHHRHCHHVIMPKCALHNNFLQTSNSKLCPHLIPQLLQTPTPRASTIPLLRSSGFQPPPHSQDIQNIQDDGVGEYEEDEEEDDPVFVMTDEWRDFFAKSEAKRREAKKLAKKQGKR